MEKILDVVVCKMPAKLVAHGVSVETIWGQGYKLLPEGKRILIDLIRAEGIATNKIKLEAA